MKRLISVFSFLVLMAAPSAFSEQVTTAPKVTLRQLDDSIQALKKERAELLARCQDCGEDAKGKPSEIRLRLMELGMDLQDLHQERRDLIKACPDCAQLEGMKAGAGAAADDEGGEGFLLSLDELFANPVIQANQALLQAMIDAKVIEGRIDAQKKTILGLKLGIAELELKQLLNYQDFRRAQLEVAQLRLKSLCQISATQPNPPVGCPIAASNQIKGGGLGLYPDGGMGILQIETGKSGAESAR